jgi:hypothetical protein
MDLTWLGVCSALVRSKVNPAVSSYGTQRVVPTRREGLGH